MNRTSGNGTQTPDAEYFLIATIEMYLIVDIFVFFNKPDCGLM